MQNADDADGAGKLKNIKQWWETIKEHAPMLMYDCMVTIYYSRSSYGDFLLGTPDTVFWPNFGSFFDVFWQFQYSREILSKNLSTFGSKLV